MIRDLQRIQWRRLTIDYGPMSIPAMLMVHAVCIGKSIPIVRMPAALKEMSVASAEGVAALVVDDFVRVVGKYDY